jgi:hypothetical protein
LKLIENSYELAQSLDVSASVSVFHLSFGGSAKARYLSTQQINSFSLYLLVSVQVSNPDMVISRPRLTDEARRLLESRGWDAFEQSYGPEYMSGVSTGGYYYGLIHIQTRSQEEREETRVRISASGGWGTGSASGNASLNQTLREITRNREIRVTVLQSGGSGDPLEMTMDDMITQALAFPGIARVNPVAYQGIFAEYKNTVPLPDSIGEGTFDRQRRLDVLEEIGRKYFYYKDLRSNIDYVINHILEFEEYQSMEDGAVREKLDNFNRDFQGVSNQINDLVRHARICRESPRDCSFPTNYYVPIEPLPRIEGQNMMLKNLEEEVARLRQQIDQAHSRINAFEDIANCAGSLGHAINNIHAKTRNTHAFNSLKDYLRRVNGGDDLGFGDH